MTNQVNQAFEYRRGLEGYVFSDGTPDNADYGITHDWFQYGYQAATQASESEINSLNQRVEAIQADNLRLREALERIVKAEDNVYNCEDDYQGDVIGKLSDIHFKAYNKARKALSTTPAQSLAEHYNEVIERCAKACKDDWSVTREVAFNKATKAIRALKTEKQKGNK